MANLSDKVSPSGVLTTTGDGSGLTGLPKPFAPVAVSGVTPSLDVGAYNFFQQGALTANTTVSFASVPTNAKWQYSYVSAGVVATPLDISKTTLTSKNHNVGSEESNASGIGFSSDGTWCLVSGSGNNTIYQYSLSTGWDIDTMSYDSVSLDLEATESELRGMTVKPDGTKFYICGDTGRVRQYTMSTPYDLNTASYTGQYNHSGSSGRSLCIKFKPDGLAMYLLEYDADTIKQYTLSSAWDITTASYASKSLSYSSQEAQGFGFAFNSDGSKLLLCGQVHDTIFQYNLSSPYDLNTGSYGSKSFSVGSEQSSPTNIEINYETGGLYLLGTSPGAVLQYQLELEAFSLTLPTIVGTPSAPTVGDHVTYTFVTKDSGTTVDLIAESIIK